MQVVFRDEGKYFEIVFEDWRSEKAYVCKIHVLSDLRNTSSAKTKKKIAHENGRMSLQMNAIFAIETRECNYAASVYEMVN